MEKSQKHIIIVAGEPSGDMHAAHLVEKIKKLDPSIKFSGLGGPQMQGAGVKLYGDLTKYATIGFVEFLKHFINIKRLFHCVIKKVKETRPDAVVLVDFPGFNLRLAKKLKEFDQKIIYYISPQVWASREGRIETIHECVDKILVFFKFEKELYEKHGINVVWVGHPLLDVIKADKSKEAFLTSIGLPPSKLTIGLLPGSREKEIETILPLMLGAARLLYRKNKQLQFVILKAEHLTKGLLKKHITPGELPLKMVDAQTYNGIHAADICMVASGTATLEVGIFQKPMVIIYKTSLLTWALAKIFIKIRYIGLINVVAGKKIVPECIQFGATPENIARRLKSILKNELKAAEIITELKKAKETLGEPGARRRAAEEILRSL